MGKSRQSKDNALLLILALLVVIANGFIGHFFAPNGIMLTPIVLILTTGIVCLTDNMHPILISIFSYFYVALNDILLKLYAGGSHDEEGLAWMAMFLLFGLVPSFIILVATVFRTKQAILAVRLLAVVLFIALVAIHLSVFERLGLGQQIYWYEWNN
ncbi:MAG: hypothetical protein JST49_05760 [Bacteroidetes bacterium]|nr:hypothetical protein [Bacteroidota bacterium]